MYTLKVAVAEEHCDICILGHDGTMVDGRHNRDRLREPKDNCLSTMSPADCLC